MATLTMALYKVGLLFLGSWIHNRNATKTSGAVLRWMENASFFSKVLFGRCFRVYEKSTSMGLCDRGFI